jgi:hypothetical protein
MSVIVDNIVAYRILTMLVTPFTETDAYKLGIIDEYGDNLIKSKDLTTLEQKNAYTYLHRLVFNLKKIINKLPGGDSKLKNIVAAFFLIKEAYKNNERVIREDQVHKILSLLEDGYILVEEECFVNRYLTEDGAIANVAGPAVCTDQPVVKKKIKKLHTVTKEKSSRKMTFL